MPEVVPSAQEQYSPGEFFVRMTYARENRPHSHQLPVSGAALGGAVGASPTSFAGWQFSVEGNAVNTPVNAATAIDAYVDAARGLFTADTTFIDATLYRQEAPGAAPQPVATHAFTAKVGTAPANTAQRLTLKTTITFRTALFSTFKVVLIETFYSTLQRSRGATAVSLAGALSTYILGAPGSWIVGRDGARPATLIGFSVTEDNGLRKRFF